MMSVRLTDEQRALVEQHLWIADRVVAARVRRSGDKHLDEFRDSAYYGLCLAAKTPVPPGTTFQDVAFRRCAWQIIDDLREDKMQAGSKPIAPGSKYRKSIVANDSCLPECGQIATRRDKADWVAVADTKMDAEQFMDRLPVKTRNTLHSMFYVGGYRGRYSQETWYVKKSAATYAGDTASRFYLFARNNLVRAAGWRVRVREVLSRFNATATHPRERVTHTFISWWMKRHGFSVIISSGHRYIRGLSWRLPNEQPNPDCSVPGVRPVDLIVHRSGCADRPYVRSQADADTRKPAAAAKPRRAQDRVGAGQAAVRGRIGPDQAGKLRRRRDSAARKGQ